MPVPKDFPSSAELERVRQEWELYCLYASKDPDPEKTSDRWKFRLKEFFESDKQKAAILDTAIEAAGIIVEAGTDFLLGEPPKIEAAKGDQAKVDEIARRNSLVRKLAESCDMAQAVGHAHFKIYSENSKAVIEEVPYNFYFPEWSGVPMGADPKNVRIAANLTVEENGKTDRYIYVEDYYMEGGTARIAFSLYEDKSGKRGEQVPLSTVGMVREGAVAGMTVVQDTKLDELPIVTINLRKTVNERYGRSTLIRVKTLLHQLNDRLTQVNIEFLKHLKAKMQVPANSVVRDRNGKVSAAEIEVFLAEPGDPDAKYITDDNPLIEHAFTSMEKILRKIAKLTKTPDRFLCDEEKGGVERVDSLKIQLIQFFKRTRFLQSLYDEAIKSLYRIAFKIEGGKDIELKVTFDPGLPKDWETDARVWGDARAAGLASRETAVSRFQGIEGDALKEELAKIDADEKALRESMLADAAAMEDEDTDEE